MFNAVALVTAAETAREHPFLAPPGRRHPIADYAESTPNQIGRGARVGRAEVSLYNFEENLLVGKIAAQPSSQQSVPWRNLQRSQVPK